MELSTKVYFVANWRVNTNTQEGIFILPKVIKRHEEKRSGDRTELTKLKTIFWLKTSEWAYNLLQFFISYWEKYLKLTQQTFQPWFNVVFRLIWRRDVAQRQINVETTLWTSTMKLTTLNNSETTLYFSTLNWTKLDNVERTLSFSTSIFTMLGNIKTTLQIWPFEKKIKPRFKSKIIFLSFKEYAGLKIFFIFSPF